MSRPLVVEAYMMHHANPFITERLANGKFRKVARLQMFGENAVERMLAHYRATYGERWAGKLRR